MMAYWILDTCDFDGGSREEKKVEDKNDGLLSIIGPDLIKMHLKILVLRRHIKTYPINNKDIQLRLVNQLIYLHQNVSKKLDNTMHPCHSFQRC